MSNGSAGGYIEPVNPEKWDPLPVHDGEIVMSRERILSATGLFYLDYLTKHPKEPTDG